MSFPLEGGGNTYQGHIQMNPAEGVMTTMIPATQLTGFQTDYTQQSQPAQQQGTTLVSLSTTVYLSYLSMPMCLSASPFSVLSCGSSFLLTLKLPRAAEKPGGGNCEGMGREGDKMIVWVLGYQICASQTTALPTIWSM